jgi:hypothetical protein
MIHPRLTRKRGGAGDDPRGDGGGLAPVRWFSRPSATAPDILPVLTLVKSSGGRLGACSTLRPVAVSTDEARSLALSLPEAIEQDHHGRPSFRVGGRIFATLWNDARMNVMVDEGGIRTAAADAPDVCEEVWWGTRLAAVAVDLTAADRDVLADLLADAWEQKAPKRLLGH